MVLDKIKCEGSGLGRRIVKIRCSLLLILLSYSYISSRTLKAELFLNPCRRRKVKLPTRGLGTKLNPTCEPCDVSLLLSELFRINYYPLVKPVRFFSR